MIQDIMDFLSQADPEVGASIQKEFDREQHNIELIEMCIRDRPISVPPPPCAGMSKPSHPFSLFKMCIRDSGTVRDRLRVCTGADSVKLRDQQLQSGWKKMSAAWPRVCSRSCVAWITLEKPKRPGCFQATKRSVFLCCGPGGVLDGVGIGFGHKNTLLFVA